jgi:2-polyprenyl-6-methoxyphenol hydroxylase-like FAD-dependent oxidoreductase
MNVLPEAPHQPRGGVILPMEGDRWHVTMIGMNGNYPPTDPDGFMAFARSMPSQRYADAIAQAEPLTDPLGYRQADNRLRHYDRLPRYLEGFLLCGDSVYALNPVYGQGMTIAAMDSMALDQSIRQQRQRFGENDLGGLAESFQKELGKVVVAPWQLATGQDRRWPAARGVGALNPVTKLVQSYFDLVMKALVHNPQVAEAFSHVLQMISPPTILFRPAIFFQVLQAAWKRRRQPSTRGALPQPLAK